jgi:hypothetical protein
MLDHLDVVYAPVIAPGDPGRNLTLDHLDVVYSPVVSPGDPALDLILDRFGVVRPHLGGLAQGAARHGHAETDRDGAERQESADFH